MSGVFSRSSALMRPESPIPRRISKSASMWNAKTRLALSRGLAGVCILLLLSFVLLRTGSTDLSASHHRKLGGHEVQASDIKVMETTEAIKAIQTNEDEDIVGVSIQHQDVISSGLNEDDLPQEPVATVSSPGRRPKPQGFYALHALDIDGNDVSMSQFVGKTVLVVNVASACGFTDQNYKGLQKLYEKYGSHGLEIIAFPSNQFGGQEPGDEKAIKAFATEKYGVTFRLMSKVDVNGPAAHPIFKYLKQNLPVDQGGGGGVGAGNDLVWNFNKFLVDKHGRPSAFYYQKYDGPRLESDVYTYLSAA